MPTKALPAIDPARCTGCGWCVVVCPPHVLSLQVERVAAWGPKRAQLHGAAGYTGCALCALRRPFDAIRRCAQWMWRRCERGGFNLKTAVDRFVSLGKPHEIYR
jgi:ferredoxin